MKRQGLRGSLLASTVWLAGVLACGAGSGRGADSAHAMQPRDTRILHETCDVDDSDTVREDVNGDGKPDRMTAEAEDDGRCLAMDFNFDGAMDAWVYTDKAGGVRRRESDYDRDGRIDEVSLYRAGALAERHRATTLIGKLDTWQYYAGGRVERTERDSNGDDYIDQWWEYPTERAHDCPLIHSDVDGDGRPDPGATVDVCKDQYVPQARDGARPVEDRNEGIADVPTEVDAPAEAAPDEASNPAPSGDKPGAKP